MSCPEGEDLVLRYEELRAQALGGQPSGPALGLALFLQKGMPGWLQAWSRCVRGASVKTAERRDEETSRPATDLLPPERLRAEVAVVLAGMALHNRRGVVA